jgi:uncharacterized protein (DUF488 family)
LSTLGWQYNPTSWQLVGHFVEVKRGHLSSGCEGTSTIPHLRGLTPWDTIISVTSPDDLTGALPTQNAILTVGHSTRSLDEFLAVLAAHDVHILADVRSYPGSRRHPQFNKECLAESLPLAGVDYYHLPELGGRRQPRKDSRNTALINEGFRGYADYMETEPFQLGIAHLLGLAASKRTAIMCAEAVWWRCHRSLISDYLKSRGVAVIHILDPDRSEPHTYTTAARIVDGELCYRGLF